MPATASSGGRRTAGAAKNFTREDLDLARDLSAFYADPLGFVLYVFPWGKKGTRLADEAGPDEWQITFLDELGKAVREGMDVADALPMLFAVASGHGIGKTALISWIILWFISTREFPQIVVTAGKKDQLTSKTWRELAKWNKLSINGHWFVWTATKLEHALYPDMWYAHAIPWSKNAPENFAGTHEKHVLVLYDEASAIDDVIWEVTDGAMTTPNAMWIAFGNPTKNTGRFFDCFNKFRRSGAPSRSTAATPRRPTGACWTCGSKCTARTATSCACACAACSPGPATCSSSAARTCARPSTGRRPIRTATGRCSGWTWPGTAWTSPC